MTGGGVYNAYEYPPHHRAEMSFYAPTNNIVIKSVYKSIVSLLEKSKLFFFFTGIVLGALFVYMAMLVQDDEYTTAMHINPLPVSGSGSGNTKYYINLMKARRGWMDKDYEAADGGRSSETQHEPTTKKQEDEKRELKAYGSGAALFVQYGAYRGASNSFAVVGLASKPLYVFGEPRFECYWEPIYTLGSNNRSSSSAPRDVRKQHGKRGIKGIAKAMLPDVGYGRVYTTVVVNCTFNETVGSSSSSSSSSSSPSPSLVLGGQLVLYASAGLSNDPLIRNATIRKRSKKERIVALRESGGFNESRFDGPPYPYDILYCGSPIFGHVNEARIRDWMAYHVRLFGARSHFVFHDAGGMHPRVRAVLEPWRRKGHVTIQDVRAEAEFDSHYHNQFLLLNDCLHRTRFLANWTFFFDVDEFIYVAPELSIHKILSWHANDTLLRFQQLRMSNSVCIPHPPANPRAACNSTRVGAHKDANNPTIMRYNYLVSIEDEYITLRFRGICHF